MHFSREILSHVRAISTSVLSRLDSFCVVSPAFSLPLQTPELAYKKQLSALGIKPRTQTQHAIPLESQEATLETLFEFVKNTRLEYAYQMLLLLALLNQSDTDTPRHKWTGVLPSSSPLARIPYEDASRGSLSRSV